MPSYYPTYSSLYPPYYGGTVQPSYSSIQQAPQYMINVDGEMSARAWQMPNNLPPNTIIPLFDLDGQHVYFKSIDSYGRMNPLRKGHIVFDDEPQQVSTQEAITMPDLSNYVTKDDLESLRQEIRNLRSGLQPQQNKNNQNGNNNRG